jgi:multiple sugar transport system ATP-binding protein
MARVLLKNIVKKYGNVEAVKNLNLEIKDREFLCLLGPSGCGKSSTLRMIAGLEEITSGELWIGDEYVNHLEPKDRDIAMVFENYALYPHKNVFENLAYPLRVRKLSQSEVDKRVNKAAETLQINELLNRMPDQLSGGQKQRVSIGRAIVREPKAFLLDEPISHLDAKLRTHMRGELKHLQRVLNTTMIYVTHDQLEAISMADRIVIMNYGEIQQIGTPDEIFNHPKNIFVAGFVGDPPMNFIEGSMNSEDDKVFFANQGFKVPLSDIQNKKVFNGADFTNGGSYTLGIRPEDIVISREQMEGFHAHGNVYVTSPVGKDMIIEVEIENHRLKIITPVDFDVDMGQDVFLRFNTDKIHYFDKDSSQSLL